MGVTASMRRGEVVPTDRAEAHGRDHAHGLVAEEEGAPQLERASPRVPTSSGMSGFRSCRSSCGQAVVEADAESGQDRAGALGMVGVRLIRKPRDRFHEADASIAGGVIAAQ
jgi:hypothetical protein